jgi:hypothetical protein
MFFWFSGISWRSRDTYFFLRDNRDPQLIDLSLSIDVIGSAAVFSQLIGHNSASSDFIRFYVWHHIERYRNLRKARMLIWPFGTDREAWINQYLEDNTDLVREDVLELLSFSEDFANIFYLTSVFNQRTMVQFPRSSSATAIIKVARDMLDRTRNSLVQTGIIIHIFFFLFSIIYLSLIRNLNAANRSW